MRAGEGPLLLCARSRSTRSRESRTVVTPDASVLNVPSSIGGHGPVRGSHPGHWARFPIDRKEGAMSQGVDSCDY
jgi:hypothetical protein